MTNSQIRGYGVFLQDGGQVDMSASADQQMMAEQEAMAQQQGGGGDPQAMAQEFLQAFGQLPPEAQQMVMQALTQQQ